ncbi:hypothetical protein GHT06_006372 [Daphnia sinensis]|uniref:Serine protease HTRA2, mitochondrial n=1 Tax=Daphnia sinensis TaxID=1820382 RepID=A0AAD5KE59_9CRUS|nr:hypothetical protein GHT06_006372 [Daphnia sinensis]
MDIALLKINADEKLPYTAFANSDSVKIGEWVLAVGNPYNLTSTVTAGIVSAKARNLDTSGIQSFIQTDAAVNPGNSGGALVNTRGELIGINTMISSPTGSYTGYSFAVPSNIARKIIEDIMEYGNVQRGILGVEGGELNSKSSKELGISQTEGFYVNKVTKRSGAEKAGLQKGDVIIKLDNQSVATFADLSGYINTKRPNDKVAVTIIREAASCTTNAITPILKVIEDSLGIVKGHLETIHAYTNDQNLVDNMHKKYRRGRAAALNMVITETGAGTAVAKAIPSLDGKLTSNAIRVPVPNGSLVVLNLEVNQTTTIESVNAIIKKSALEVIK